MSSSKKYFTPSFENQSLLQLLSLPTAPYRENRVRNYIEEECKKFNIPYFLDSFGNLILGVQSKTEYLKLFKKEKDEPLRIFIAHMDHPGFHGIRWLENGHLEIQWFGGSPVQKLENASIRLHLRQPSKQKQKIFSNQSFKGTLKNITLHAHGKALFKAEIMLESPFSNSLKDRPVATDLYGSFDFSNPVWIEGENLYSKCCDDLIGVHAILENAKKFFSQKRKGKNLSFIALLTRAEEVGFIGAIGHFELKWILSGKRPRFVVSLETSRTLPGADIGMGPIVRLGDRLNVFDPSLTHWLSGIALKTLPNEHQKRIMDKGACEASAALAYGLRTIALSVPLGNYHNESFEGGPHSLHPAGPAPEFVALKDIDRLVKIVEAIITEKVSMNALDLYKNTRQQFKKSLQNAKSLLK